MDLVDHVRKSCLATEYRMDAAAVMQVNLKSDSHVGRFVVEPAAESHKVDSFMATCGG